MAVRKHPRYPNIFQIFYLNFEFNFEEKLRKLILRCKLVHSETDKIPRQLKTNFNFGNIQLKNWIVPIELEF